MGEPTAKRTVQESSTSDSNKSTNNKSKKQKQHSSIKDKLRKTAED
jgi:hypothetical protein